MTVSSIAPPAEGRRAASDALFGGSPNADSFADRSFAAPSFGDEDLSAPRFSEYRPETTVAAPAPAPAPKATRPTKGRYFVATILVAICGFAAYSIWNSFFRYAAYGVVEGKTLEVAAPWEGVVQQVYVREGDLVAVGQVLASLDNPDLRARLLKLEEELRIARAELSAESARLAWEEGVAADRKQRALSDYYVAFAELQSERAQLGIDACRLERAKALSSDDAIAGAEVETAEFREAGQRRKVAKLEKGLAELRHLAIEVRQEVDSAPEQLRPHLLRIESLQNEIARASERLARGLVRSPISGKVLDCRATPGDRAAAHRTMLRIVAAGSVEIALYAPQGAADSFPIGRRLEVTVAPHDEAVICEVVRLGEKLAPAPPSIERYYLARQQLLPIYLRPQRVASDGELRLGSVAVLPRSLSNSLDGEKLAKEDPAP